MSSDRTIYDKGAYLAKTKESSKPLSYLLDLNAYEGCEVCGDKPNVTNHADRISLENDLKGITRKLSRDPKQKYQKNVNIANTLDYSPAYLCERNLQNSKFLNNVNGNEYMDKLKKLSPKQLGDINTNTNADKLTNFLSNNNVRFTNQV